jgi:predicted enzyme related to lactoylglutathione lyase
VVNPLIFVDLPTPDPEATSVFYEKLFDWQYKRRPAGEFHEVLPGVKPNLGIHLETTPVTGPVPQIYVLVDDPPEKLALALEMGATKLFDETYWEEFDARRAAFRDPWGNEVVLWRNKGTYVPGSASESDKAARGADAAG